MSQNDNYSANFFLGITSTSKGTPLFLQVKRRFAPPTDTALFVTYHSVYLISSARPPDWRHL